MNKTTLLVQFRYSAISLAVCAVFVPAQAQTSEDGAKASVAVGVGLLDGGRDDRALFDQYSGISKDKNAIGLLGFDYALRTNDPYNWVELHGSDLLGDTSELNFLTRKPGEWKFKADYGELVHRELNQVNTGLVNSGSTTPQVSALVGGAGTGSNFDLQTKRTKLGLAYTKVLSPRMQFDVDLKTENKKGSRLFGIGMNCPTVYDPACAGTTGIQTGWATLMLPEPIDSNHSQIDARLSYALEKLRFSVGYYGSFYRNANSAMYPAVSGNLYNPVGTLLPLSPGLLGYLNQPVSLSPDSQAHQIDVTGNYAFTDKTRSTFKLAYSTARQDDAFIGASQTGQTSLGGRVNSALAQFGITSRPMPKLSLSANLRYNNKEDVTPIAAYNLAGLTPYTNQNLSSRQTNAKLQANWQFNSDYSGTLGADYENIDRGTFTATSAIAGVTALRENTEETTVRAELRRILSETFSGAISVSRSERSGSSWLRDNSGLGVSGVINYADPAVINGIFSPVLADRQRDKVKVYGNWMPDKKWVVQFSAEDGTDKFTSPSVYGLHDTSSRQFALDWSYVMSFRLQLNGYASRGGQTFNQSRYAGYVMGFDNTNTTLSFGFAHQPTNKWNWGGAISYVDDINKYSQALDATADAYTVASLAASGGLPDIKFQQTTLKLFGKYIVDKKSTVRVDFVHQKSAYNDWAWSYNGVPYIYSDGTTLGQKVDQSASFLGITYIYSFD